MECSRFLFTLLMCGLVLSSCGKAPLFHHVDESDLVGNILGQTPDPHCNGKYGFPKLALCYDIKWRGPISTLGDNPFSIQFYENDQPVELSPLSFHAYIWMPEPHMNHGSAPFRFSNLGNGKYNVSNVYFIMSGYWELHIQMKEKDVVIDEDIIAINL